MLLGKKIVLRKEGTKKKARLLRYEPTLRSNITELWRQNGYYRYDAI